MRVLSTNHPLKWTLTYGGDSTTANVNIHQDDHANIVAMIGSHPKTRTITNAELRAGVTNSDYSSIQWLNTRSITIELSFFQSRTHAEQRVMVRIT